MLILLLFLAIVGLSDVNFLDAGAIAAPSLNERRTTIIHFSGLTIRFPNEYSPHLTSTDTGSAREITVDEIGMIVFWMPDLSAPENDFFLKRYQLPSESLRPNPTSDRYVVFISSLGRRDKMISHGGATPAKIIQNLLSLKPQPKIVFENGMSRIMFDAKSTNLNDYFDINNTNVQFNASCDAIYSPNPSCRINLYLREYDLIASIIIPEAVRYEIPDIVKGVVTLIDRWRV